MYLYIKYSLSCVCTSLSPSFFLSRSCCLTLSLALSLSLPLSLSGSHLFFRFLALLLSLSFALCVSHPLLLSLSCLISLSLPHTYVADSRLYSQKQEYNQKTRFCVPIHFRTNRFTFKKNPPPPPLLHPNIGSRLAHFRAALYHLM